MISKQVSLLRYDRESNVHSPESDEQLVFVDVSATGERRDLSIKITFSEGLLIFATDASTAIHSPASELVRPAASYELISDARRELLRFIENAVGNLYSTAKTSLDSNSKALKSKIGNINSAGLALFTVESAVCWVLVFLAARNMAKVQSANLHMIALLSNIRKEDVDRVNDRCSSFFLTHLAEYFDTSVSEILESRRKEDNPKKQRAKFRAQQDTKLQTEAKDNRRLQ